MINSQTFQSNSYQDWETVTFKKKHNHVKQNVNLALQNNMAVETIRKPVHNNIATRKLENETEDFHVKRVPISVGKDIEKARVAKKLTQDALAKSLNLNARVINDIEKGNAVYDGQLLSKIKRFLGI